MPMKTHTLSIQTLSVLYMKSLQTRLKHKLSCHYSVKMICPPKKSKEMIMQECIEKRSAQRKEVHREAWENQVLLAFLKINF